MAPPKPKKKSNSGFTRTLKARGFDLSYYDRNTGYHKARCSQCASMVVNGTPIHERGCPNEVKD